MDKEEARKYLRERYEHTEFRLFKGEQCVDGEPFIWVEGVLYRKCLIILSYWLTNFPNEDWMDD